MKTYLVTGGCGFIGSHMVDKLISLGHRVYVIDNLSAKSNEVFYKSESSNAIYYHSIDVRDRNGLFDLLEKIYNEGSRTIDAVFHFAAEARIQPMIKDPMTAIDTNIKGTVNVLEACRHFGIRKMIHSSTSSVYGNSQELPVKETANRNPLNPYSISKACAEDFCLMYHRMWELDVTILRYFNVFGERQPIRGTYAPVVGKFLRQWDNGEALTVVGSGTQRRDFTWVGDVVEANHIVAVTNCDLAGEIINVGTGSNISIIDLAEGISDDVWFTEERPGEAKETLADNSKMSSIGWVPRKNIEEWVKERMVEKRFSSSERIY